MNAKKTAKFRYWSCTRKARFNTWLQAHAFTSKKSLERNIYPCRFCDGWHLASIRERNKS